MLQAHLQQHAGVRRRRSLSLLPGSKEFKVSIIHAMQVRISDLHDPQSPDLQTRLGLDLIQAAGQPVNKTGGDDDQQGLSERNSPANGRAV